MLHLYNYNENRDFLYCVFRLILDTYGIIMRNKYHIYFLTLLLGEEEWFTLLLWTRGTVYTIALKTMNRFHYCYEDKEWFPLLLWRQ